MRSWLAVLVVLSACGSDLPAPRPEKPTAPDTNDPAYQVDVPAWWVVGNAATQTDDTMQIVVTPPAGTDFVDAWIGDLPVQRLTENTDGRFFIQTSVTDLAAGTYDILLAADGSTTAFAKMPLYRSAPYYVLVTTDWDFSDPSDRANGYQDKLHQDHPEIRITHFVGPYTFTDPAVTPERAQQIVDWVVKQRDTFHDEIGLHIHPYCNFVEHAGVTCVTDQSTVYPAGDTTGYTIKLGAYGHDNMAILLQHAIDLFQAHGLGRPVTFRAGGWTATIDTLHALADKGFVADTSALNWARIEEWKGKELYDWTMANWAPIGDTSQPYYPGEDDPLAHASPAMPLLEAPDNGVMIDYVTLAEMNGIFDANWDGKPLAAPITLVMGFHPSDQLPATAVARVDGFLKYADQHLATHHLGPVVYITLHDVVAAFSP